MTCWEVRHFNHFGVFGIFIWSSVIESKKTGKLSWGKCSLVLYAGKEMAEMFYAD